MSTSLIPQNRRKAQTRLIKIIRFCHPMVWIACFVLATSASVQSGTIIEFPPNVNNFDTELVEGDKDAQFYPSRAKATQNPMPPHAFESSQTCAGCHQEIYNQWKESVMAQAWEDPIYRGLIAKASEATGGATDNFCIGCHSPIGLTTGTASAVGEDTGHAPGVDCESCHNISASTGNGNGAYVLTPKMFGKSLKFGPRADAQSPYHDTAYSELHTKSEFCATCHNVTHPFNELAVERTYDEWRDSVYNAQGIECQDCHMAPEPGLYKSSPMGKERKDGIASHYFAAANTTLYKHFGSEKMAERATKVLQSAATIEITSVKELLKVYGARFYEVKVKVTNVGAGHKLPTGFPEGREVWIDFQVTDNDGKEIYRLGEVTDGHTEKGTKNYKAVLADKDNNVIDIEVWKADRILKDTRILPKGYAEETYMFSVPAEAATPLNITADLRYWSFPQQVVDMIVGEGKVKVDIVDMVSVKQKLPIDNSEKVSSKD